MDEHTGDPVGLSLGPLTSWLREQHPELVSSTPLRATLLRGGLSNLTYRIDGGFEPLVLRRPPLGHVLQTAHDMHREFRIISALESTPVPVPRAIAFRDDSDKTAGVGTPFYLMQYVDGSVLSSTARNAGFESAKLRDLSFDLVECLATLHGIQPDSIDLNDFGHPSGFLVRQLRRWGQQYEQSASRELPELDVLQEALRSDVPDTLRSSLIHGDYRLDNVIVAVDSQGAPTIAAILDWEMATIGDSFTDLGLLGLYWDIRTVSADAAAVAGSAVDPAAGYPSFTELVEVYSAARRMPVPELSWYIAFAAYKLSVILEGIHFRFGEGKTVGPGFEKVGELVTPLARYGLRSLDSRGGAVRHER